ncbi:MAG: PIN domain-containing protein [Roseomonas mucosa]|nr:PIN domain-containing protein [Roseomonas mucosa]
MLAYAESVNGAEWKETALAIVRGVPAADVILPLQTLGELFVVLTRKAKWPAAQARIAVQGWEAAYAVAPTTPPVLAEAMQLATDHRFALWDAIMLAVAAQAGCALLLSEDMQNGFVWRGVTIRDPFTAGSL